VRDLGLPRSAARPCRRGQRCHLPARPWTGRRRP
jgi:hypothetical protein